ncbi:ubiquinol-cytochrome-c reductase complex assembly factor 1 [Planococcus citri]|uniref:ubiquinol-cytochrome-c reductase complex assembly factor 1 n=1 Tax=Planococcus citri TaxID=170843 RepID=UPI0031F76716
MLPLSFMRSSSMIRVGKSTAHITPITSYIQMIQTDKVLDYNMRCGRPVSTCGNLYSKALVAPEEKRPSLVKKIRSIGKENIIVKYIKGIQSVSHFKVSKAELSTAAYFTYEDLIEMIPVDQFFIEFQMPDTFASWFTVVELHLWLISARIMKEETIGYHARDMLTEAFFADVVYRSSLLGPRASVYRQRQVATLALQFTAAYYGYDEGVQSSDKVLAAIVWRRFFGFECNDARQIERIVKYIRVQLDHLCYLTFDDIMFKRTNLVIPLDEVQLD